MTHKIQNKVAATIAATIMLLTSAAAFADAEPFKTDGHHTRIRFVASTLLFDVDGWFDRYNIDAKVDPKNLKNSKVNVAIKTKSINTNNKDRDAHLRKPDFFHASKYPEITFESTKITPRGKKKVIVEGELKMHGKSKKVKIPFTRVQAKNGAGKEQNVFKGDLRIKLSEFGIGNDSLAAKISLKDEVDVKLVIAGFIQES